MVSIGGGTGLSTLLKGLKRYSHAHGDVPAGAPALDLTAVVTVTDDGGSSGRLRREFGVLPPGDIRNCMVALAEDESLLTQLFRFRFESGRGLKGHSFGNLFLTALTEIIGDFPSAVRRASEVLAIAGRIYPSTTTRVALSAVLEDGTAVDGESRISRSSVPIKSIRLVPSRPRPLDETLEAIHRADLITLGPGSLYTSVIPNLLVRGISQAIESSRALKACFVNLMSQPGETTGMMASDHVRALLDHAGRPIVDVAVVNTAPVAAPARKRYARQKAMPVFNDVEEIRELGVDVVGLPLLAEGGMVRHDPERVSAITLQLAKKGRRRILREFRSKR